MKMQLIDCRCLHMHGSTNKVSFPVCQLQAQVISFSFPVVYMPKVATDLIVQFRMMSKSTFLASALAIAMLFSIIYSQSDNIHSEIHSRFRSKKEAENEQENSWTVAEATMDGSSVSPGHGRVTTTAAVKEKRAPRILCWILTGVANHMTKAIHVKQTWGRRCDILLFMSSQHEEILGSIALPGVEEGHGKLWPKTQKAFQYAWEHHRDDADWFFKADDDTYVFTDNLRSFLGSHDPNKAHYFGAVADYGNNTVVNLGGAGYVVSKEALRLFIQDAMPDTEKCHTEMRPRYKGDEDTEFGMCLQSVGVLPGNAKDAKGRNLFRIDNPFKALTDVKNAYKKWQRLNSWFSERTITFHYLKPEEMYACELLSNYVKQRDD